MHLKPYLLAILLALLAPAGAPAAERPADYPLADPGFSHGSVIKYYEGQFTQLPDFTALKPKYASYQGGWYVRRCDSWTNFANTIDGYLKISAPGAYTFYLNSNDGSRLYFGNVLQKTAALVVDNDGLHAMQEKSGTIELAAGYHQFTVQYFHGPAIDNQGLQILWTGPGIAKKQPPITGGDKPVVFWRDDGVTPYGAQSYVQIEALVQKSPPQITLNWNTDPANNPSEYTLYKKTLAATSWGQPYKDHIPATTPTFTDTQAKIGEPVEYKIEAAIHTRKFWSAAGIIRAGIDIPAIQDRGTVILLVDKTMAEPLAAELARQQQDLIGDGWTVLRHDVDRAQPNFARADATAAVAIRELIQADYKSHPNVQAVYILGHIPIPYSGWYVLGHNNSDLQPHNADVYYGNLAGSWTDSETFPSNNLPNDGKFDQDYIPSPVELAVGRVDFCNLKGLPADQETATLRQYLTKNHNFRHVLIAPPKLQGKIITSGAAAQTSFVAYENSWPLFGQAKTSVDKFAGDMTKNFAAMDHRLGAAYYPVPDCVHADFKVTFLTAYVSFVDSWSSNAYIPFLRQALAMPTYSLVALSANDAFYLSPMALGETAGYCLRSSQNSRGLYPFMFDETGDIKMALLGDPTLRLNPIQPPTNLTATAAAADIALAWTASPDASVVGYNVYRAASPAGPFTAPLNPKLLPPTATAYTDPNAAGHGYCYMLRAISYETTGSGTYFNPSQGAFAPAPQK